MEDSPLLRIWSRIRDELASLQDQAPPELSGHVVNPISGSVFFRDTAFAAQVFATEYQRSRDKKWFSRAENALIALDKINVYSGLDEPVWNRYGWHFNKGSMATTGMLLNALWETEEMLDVQIDREEKWQGVIGYVKDCSLGNGLFSHDKVRPGYSPSPVQNTSAMALYLLEYIAKKRKGGHDLAAQECAQIYEALKAGQRPDGFWPYIHPDRKQQLFFRSNLIRRISRYIPFFKRFFLKTGDNSIYFGDAIHHSLVLYYLAKSLVVRGTDHNYLPVLQKGWNWTKKHLIETPSGGLRFDFDWEPKPFQPRYCNFRETSTYFVIIATLPLLDQLGVIKHGCNIISSCMLIHIEEHLMNDIGILPCIKPYEGPIEILRNILPRVGESVAWKGSDLSAIMLL